MDRALFEVIGNELHFLSLPSFSNPADNNGDSVYNIDLVARSNGLDSPAQSLEITVVSQNNVAPDPPTISNDAIPENTQTVGLLSATDSDGDPVYFSITGGADAALFELTEGNTLVFITTPDFESPSDSDNDNTYELTVVADDALKTSAVTPLNITVQNVFDVPATDILLDGASVEAISLYENLEAGTVVAILSVLDIEPGDTHLIDLTTDSSGRFTVINGNELAVTGDPLLDFEADDAHVIRIRAIDAGGNSFTKRIDITVLDIDETSVLQRQDFTRDTNTHFTWLHHEHTGGFTPQRC